MTRRKKWNKNTEELVRKTQVKVGKITLEIRENTKANQEKHMKTST